MPGGARDAARKGESMTLVDLTHTLRTGLPVYPGDPVTPEIVRLSDHGEGGHRSSALRTGCHAGTHVDLPLHFLAGAEDLATFPVERCVGTALLLDAPAGPIPASLLDGTDLGEAEFLVLRTGWSRHWGGPAYYRDWPYLEPALAERLTGAGLKGVGLDSPSVDPPDDETSHRILAAGGLVNVENLAHLDRLPAGRPFRLWVLPLRLAGAEASPVRAVAEVPEPC